ncbi:MULTISPECIES: molybdate ABC transporter ATP-binding protein ModF [Pasteurellaceae]|uniref:molybdate ABC transporter ATP-binding protein ModF n=1 Tax=Pasteurellaceae TaxID=712 RepID=UPI003563B4B3
MINIHDGVFQLSSHHGLTINELTIQAHSFWAVVGNNGSGKTALSLALQGAFPLRRGEYRNTFRSVACLSFEKQQRIIEQTFKDRNNDCVSPDDFGKSAKQVILNGSDQDERCQYYANQLKITALLARPFIQLSTGESRKVLLCQALVQAPDLLILDEPFAGLDVQSVADWCELLATLRGQMALVLIINRFSDIPPEADHLAILDNGELILQGERRQLEAQSIYQQLCYAQSAVDAPLPAPATPLVPLDPEAARVELKEVCIRYGDKIILDHLNWTVKPKQNWWIKGPNGAGKSTLLSIITGDHPQAYANHVVLFGRQRGSGETIWEIKRRIGYVSSQLHMDYRVNCSVADVIISGFFDSIGVYQAVPDALRIKAMQWLTRLNLGALANRPFRSLSWGQQRLLLITRAMVKHPPLLILDEPLQGLDGVNRKLVKHFIEQLVNNSETQLLFVSHQDQDAPDCITHLFEFIAKNDGYQYIQSAV